MAIYLSQLMTNGALIYQAPAEGEQATLTAVVKIPADEEIADNSVLKLARFAADVYIDEIVIRSDDLDTNGSPTLSMSCGYVRPVEDPSLALDATTNPAITGAVASDSAAYYVATATAPYQAGGVNRYEAGQSGLANEFATVNTNGIGTIIDLALTATEPAATGPTSAGYVRVTVKYSGKLATPGTFSGGDAYKYRSAY